MTKFSFRLQRVREYRVLQADLARAMLDRLYAERARVEAEHRALLEARQQEEVAVRTPGTNLTVTRLEALDQWQGYLQMARDRFAARLAEVDRRIERQREAVVEADRQVGLLDKLEERQRGEWQVHFQKELEELAAESYNSRLLARAQTERREKTA